EGLSTCTKLKEALHLKFKSKSARSRVVDSPPMTLQSVVIVLSSNIAGNVLALGAVADFEAQNCQHTTKVDARQNVQLTTEPAIEPNACYWLVFCLSSLSSRYYF